MDCIKAYKLKKKFAAALSAQIKNGSGNKINRKITIKKVPINIILSLPSFMLSI